MAKINHQIIVNTIKKRIKNIFISKKIHPIEQKEFRFEIRKTFLQWTFLSYLFSVNFENFKMFFIIRYFL